MRKQAPLGILYPYPGTNTSLTGLFIFILLIYNVLCYTTFMQYCYVQDKKGSLSKSTGPKPARMSSTNLPIKKSLKSSIQGQIKEGMSNIARERKYARLRNK